MAPGETHRYRFEVGAGELARVAVDQEGIDVAVVLYSPGGDEVTWVDSPTGAQGRETAALVAEESGGYLLKVMAPSGGEAGRYRVGLEALRPATETDRKQVAGEHAYSAGRRLDKKEEKEAFVEARGLFRQAGDDFQATGDRRRRADALKELAGVCFDLGDLDASLESYQAAFDLYDNLGEQDHQGAILNSMGRIYRRRGQLAEAKRTYEKAQRLGLEAGKPQVDLVARNNLAILFLDLGEYEKALDTFLKLREDWRDARRRGDEARAAVNVGTVYLSLGELDRAEEAFDEALSLAGEDGMAEIRVLALEQLGRAAWQRRQLDAARRALGQALGQAQRLGNPAYQGMTLNDLGLVELSAGARGAAAADFQQALAIFRQRGIVPDEAVVLLNLGALRQQERKWAESLALHEESLRRFEHLGDLAGQASAHYGAARALAAQGELEAARRRVERALDLVEDLRSSIQVDTHQASFFATKQDYYDLYVDLLMRLHARRPEAGFDARALAASERRRARGLLDLLAEAGGPPEGEGVARLLAQEGELKDQIRMVDLERIKLPDNAEPEHRDRVGSELAELVARYEGLEGEIRRRDPRYAALTQPHPLGAAEIQQLLDDDTQLLAFSLGQERSYAWLVGRHRLGSRELPGRDAIEALALRVHESLSQGWEVSRKGAGLIASAHLAETILGPFAGELTARRLVVVPDGALHYVPFAALPLPGAAGAAAAVRTGAAPASPPALLDRFEMVYLPSASVLAELRRQGEGRPQPAGSVAVLADPVFQADDPRIPAANRSEPREQAAVAAPAAPAADHLRGPREEELELAGLRRIAHSADEARAITALAPRGTTFSALGFAANRDLAVSGVLGAYRIVHFATHGVLDTAHPRLSGVVLSLVDQRGRSRDGFLRLLDVYNLHLAADLVVVSSCRSALGEEVRGEGMVGLTRGFMYAGAPRVVVSLWSVSDRATAELMEQFYRGLFERHLAPPAALRAAQEALRSQPHRSEPYFWAGFVLEGEWH
jgi:CHAT domain-containing protein/tetratricopeptide (TPR) repeat protein